MDERSQMPPTAEDLAKRLADDHRLEWLAIALGGALGACLRHAVHLTFESRLDESILGLVLPTLIVNAVGARLLGRLMGRLSENDVHSLVRPFLAVGVLGAFTTYSSLILQNSLVTTELGLAAGLIHIVGSGLVGLVAFTAGQASARASA